MKLSIVSCKECGKHIDFEKKEVFKDDDGNYVCKKHAEFTKVVFRKFKDGDIIALFPEIPEDLYGYFCMSYMTIGQHSGASLELIQSTKLAKPEEYASLKEELESIGYNLVIKQKVTYAMDEKRREVAREWRNKA